MQTSRWLIALLASTTMSAAFAQQPPATDTRPQDLEPAVDTSATPPPDRSNMEPAVDTSATPAPSEATAPGASAAPKTGAVDTPAPDAAAAPPAGAAARTAPRTGRALDRLELDTTQVTGNRELPRVLYIVPWKRADLGDLVGKPVNSLLDEVLTPVDRDVFKRENRYYRALQPDAARTPGAAAAPAAQDER
jgi:hypothetical protein